MSQERDWKLTTQDADMAVKSGAGQLGAEERDTGTTGMKLSLECTGTQNKEREKGIWERMD